MCTIRLIASNRILGYLKVQMESEPAESEYVRIPSRPDGLLD